MFKIVNRYGKSVTVLVKMKEITVFEDDLFPSIICSFLNKKEIKPDWFVNSFDFNWGKPYMVEQINSL